MSYYGKVRLYAHKTSEKRGWRSNELSDASEHFDDRLVSDVKDNQIGDILSEEIRSCGFDLFDDAISDVMENYALGDVVEILADAHIEWSKGWTDCGYEYDAEGWFENVKHRKLTDEQIKRFTEFGPEEPIVVGENRLEEQLEEFGYESLEPKRGYVSG